MECSGKTEAILDFGQAYFFLSLQKYNFILRYEKQNLKKMLEK